MPYLFIIKLVIIYSLPFSFLQELPVLHNSLDMGNYWKRGDPNGACPYHPKPIPLPSPLPANISKALTNLTEALKLVTNETCAVSLYALVCA